MIIFAFKAFGFKSLASWKGSEYYYAAVTSKWHPLQKLLKKEWKLSELTSSVQVI